MTDKELLELAAKAMGAKKTRAIDGMFQVHFWEDGSGLDWEYWDALADDGDALRLAVKLGLEVTIFLGSQRTESYQLGSTGESTSEDHQQDAYAATRRAIVRAAAEIGRNTQ